VLQYEWDYHARLTTLLQGKEAHTANRASKTALKYTAGAHEITSTPTPTHFSTAHSAPSAAPAASSSRLVTCRIVSYKTCVSASRRSGEGKKRRPGKPVG
jgi:hypothetical protein